MGHFRLDANAGESEYIFHFYTKGKAEICFVVM